MDYGGNERGSWIRSFSKGIGEHDGDAGGPTEFAVPEVQPLEASPEVVFIDQSTEERHGGSSQIGARKKFLPWRLIPLIRRSFTSGRRLAFSNQQMKAAGGKRKWQG